MFLSISRKSRFTKCVWLKLEVRNRFRFSVTRMLVDNPITVAPSLSISFATKNLVLVASMHKQPEFEMPHVIKFCWPIYRPNSHTNFDENKQWTLYYPARHWRYFFQLDNTKQLLAFFVLYIYILVAIAVVAYPWNLLCMQKSKYAKCDGIAFKMQTKFAPFPSGFGRRF